MENQTNNNVVKLQVKTMREKTGRKNPDGSAELRTIGTLLGESVEGRIEQILASGGRAFLESLVDNQLLHHQFSSAFKAKAGKEDDTEGLERLHMAESSTRQLRREKFDASRHILPEGFDASDFEGTWVVRANWSFTPGQSADALREIEAAKERKARYESGLIAQLAMLKDMLGVDELTDAQVEAAKKVVHKSVYGK